MSIDAPFLQEDETGAIRVGGSRVLLEVVIRAYSNGASPRLIVHQYSTLSLLNVCNTINYYLQHQDVVKEYLNQREQLAELVKQQLARLGASL